MSRDAEFDAISESEIFEEARDRLKIAMDAESRTRPNAKEAIRFDWGDQWADRVSTSVSQAETIELTMNFTGMLVRRVVNNMRQQRPRGKCHPVGDGANIETAEIINGIGRHVEYRSEAGVAYDCAADMAAKAGWGYCRIYAEFVAPDSFQRDIRIAPIWNIFDVYLDPTALMPAAQDMTWGLIAPLMKRTEYKRLYPRADNVEWKAGGDDRTRLDWESKEDIRLAEYFRIREKAANLYLLRDDMGNEHAVYKDDLPSPEAMALATLRVVDERQSSRRQVEWFRLNGTKVIDRKILPGQYIPIIRCVNEQIVNDGEILRKGIVKDMMDPQRMTNYGEVASIKRLSLTPQAPWVAAEGQLDGHPEWTSANRTAHPVLLYKPVTVSTGQGDVPLPPPQRQPPAQIEAGYTEFIGRMRSNLLSIAGMQNEPGQDTRGQVVSGIAQQRRDKTSDMAHFQLYDNQTLMIAQVWRIMLDWIPVYFAEPGRIQRIIGDDGVPDLVTLNAPDTEDPALQKIKNDLSVGRYDVVMDTGPGYETKREEGAETFMELLNSPLGPEIAKVGPDLAIRSIDHPYMQELADRFAAMTPDGLKKVMEQLPERAKAIVQALANENGVLKQQLQAAQSGLIKDHLMATVKAHDVEETNRTRRADTESRERTQITTTAMKVDADLKKAEIAAGGKILDTHAQAGHDARAAERMIEAGEKAERTGSSSNGSGHN